MRSRLADESILAHLEHSWLEPPYMKSNLPLCECCGCDIDEPYKIEGKYYCSECATEMTRGFPKDDDNIECDGCGEQIPFDEPFFRVENDFYCEKCFRKYVRDW